MYMPQVFFDAKLLLELYLIVLTILTRLSLRKAKNPVQ